ncbi:MAG: hypothetical protein WBA23_20520 [Tunicatimonas sp.]|uniref:hypothetical protein n=1 Tax=Tunicatimonas sp. TaxID=1940096 RepID=UPI003C77DE40
MRFSIAFFGLLVLATLPSRGQEVAVDLSIDRLSPRPVNDAPEANWGNVHHPLLAEQTNDQPDIQQYYQCKSAENAVDHRKLRYWKIQKIVRNAPVARPHFLVQSKSPRHSAGTKVPKQRHEALQEMMSKRKVVY